MPPIEYSFLLSVPIIKSDFNSYTIYLIKLRSGKLDYSSNYSDKYYAVYNM